MIGAILKRAILGFAGAVLLAVGLGFATYAVYLGLAYWYAPIAAALVLAAIYGGLGLILLYLTRVPKSDPQRPAVRLFEAFLDGMEAGKRVRQGSRRR